MSRIRELTWICMIALAVMTGCGAPATAPPAAAEPTTVPPALPEPPSAAVAGYAERLSAGDLAGTLAYFDAGARIYLFGLPPSGIAFYSGTEQISALLAENIAKHTRMEVEVISVVDDVVTARVTSWHDFRRETVAAPVEATSVYVVKDGKITTAAWHISEASLATIKRALAETVPPAAPAEVALVAPTAALKITIAGGTCTTEGQPLLQKGPVAVTLDVQDLDKEKYALTFFTLDSGKGLADLLASTAAEGPPDWVHLAAAPHQQKPGEAAQLKVSMNEGPVYGVCWSSPPDLVIGALGPFAVVEKPR